MRSARDAGIVATHGRKWRLTCAPKRRQQSYARCTSVPDSKDWNTGECSSRRTCSPKSYLCDTAVIGVASRLSQKLRAQTIDSLGSRCASTAIMVFLKHIVQPVWVGSSGPLCTIGWLPLVPKTSWQINMETRLTCNHELAGDAPQDPRQPCSLSPRASFVAELVDRSRLCNLDHVGCSCLYPRVGHASATRHRGQVVAKRQAFMGVWVIRHGSRPHGSAKRSGLLE